MPEISHVSAQAPLLRMQSNAPVQNKAPIDFARIMDFEVAKDQTSISSYHDLEKLERALQIPKQDSDIRTAVTEFLSPPQMSDTEAFLNFMAQTRGSAHPLAHQVELLQTAKTAVQVASETYDEDQARFLPEAREVMAELDTQIEALKVQIEEEAMAKVSELQKARDM